MAALEGEVDAKLSACFYKSDGRPFWCLLDIIPIKNELAEVNLNCQHFILKLQLELLKLRCATLAV